MSKHSNLDIKDTARLHIVQDLQHATSHPTTKSTQTTMVNALKKKFSLLAAEQYRNSTERSTQRHHQANEGKRGLEAERVRALGALRSLRSKRKLVAKKQQETHFITNEAKRSRLKIMLREQSLGQQSDLKTQRQRLARSRKVQRQQTMREWRPEGLNKHFMRWWLLWETVWGISQAQTMWSLGKMTMMKGLSRASWAKMTNLAAWWAQPPKWCSDRWRGFGQSRWSLKKWHNRDGTTQPTTSVKETRSTSRLN